MVEGQGQREYCKKGSTGISQLYSAHTINRVPARVEGREGTEWQMVPKDMAWHGRYQQQEQQLPLCAAGTVPGLGWVPFWVFAWVCGSVTVEVPPNVSAVLAA